jgi:hypothetical protein
MGSWGKTPDGKNPASFIKGSERRRYRKALFRFEFPEVEQGFS